MRFLALAGLLFWASALAETMPQDPAESQSRNEAAPIQANVSVERKHGAQLPLDLEFFDESGQARPLGDYLGSRPAILAFVYYECPSLCGMILSGLFRTMKELDFRPGREYEVILVSIDPREKPGLAKAKKANFVKRYNFTDSADGMHFLTGKEENIARLADTVGFSYKYDEKTNQYAHPAMLTILTPEGKVSQYHAGVEYPERALRLSLVEASEKDIGTPLDQFFLYCYRYDPHTGTYGVAIMNVLRLMGLATMAGIALIVILFLRWEHQKRERGARA